MRKRPWIWREADKLKTVSLKVSFWYRTNPYPTNARWWETTSRLPGPPSCSRTSTTPQLTTTCSALSTKNQHLKSASVTARKDNKLTPLNTLSSPGITPLIEIYPSCTNLIPRPIKSNNSHLKTKDKSQSLNNPKRQGKNPEITWKKKLYKHMPSPTLPPLVKSAFRLSWI